MLILRGRTWRFVNEGTIMDAIERAGFEAACMDEAASWADVGAVAREVDVCDVLVGAHGAGLTNMVFLCGSRGGAGHPVGEDGSLRGRVLRRPSDAPPRRVQHRRRGEHAVRQARQGPPGDRRPRRVLQERHNAKFYWREQNIRLTTTRFAPTLQMVKQMLRE